MRHGIPRRAFPVLALLLLGVGLVCAQERSTSMTFSSPFLGPDALWRARETLVLHLYDTAGKGFGLTVDVRDMNTYAQGEQPALLLVIGPSGNTLVRQGLPDDGIVSGNEQYRDGAADVWLDFRYRAYHQVFSPDGVPPGKKRSPFLGKPERIFRRRLQLDVPADGPGVYRIVALGCYDHWFAFSPDRDLPAAMHSGPGPLVLHGKKCDSLWFYAPPNTEDIGIMLAEEESPFHWSMELVNGDGKVLGRTQAPADGALNRYVERNAPGDRYYQIRSRGTSVGTNLHLCGVPALFCPDKETARLFRGGRVQDDKGRQASFGSQLRLLAWCDALTPDQLKAPPAPAVGETLLHKHGKTRITLEDIARILEQQDLDPASPTYGAFRAGEDEAFEKKFTFWVQKVDMVAKAAGWEADGNPYFDSPALVRRALLNRARRELQSLTGFLWFGGSGARTSDSPRTYPETATTIFDGPYRSQWVPMHGAKHAHTIAHMRPQVDRHLAADVRRDWFGLIEQWIQGKAMFQQGGTTNQWCSILATVVGAAKAIDSPTAKGIIKEQLDRILTKGNVGRNVPDPDPFATKSRVGYGYAANAGYVGSGHMAEAGGHDPAYIIETNHHLLALTRYVPHPGYYDYLNDYLDLKSHITFSRKPGPPKSIFGGTACATDSNHRTRFHSHKVIRAFMTDEEAEKVPWLDLWQDLSKRLEHPRKRWPYLRDDPFVKNIDNEYYFVNTSGYYCAVYGGAANHAFENWRVTQVEGNTVRLVGMGKAGYGQMGRKSTKIGGISAVYVRGFGPVLLSFNHNVMLSNTVWGRTREKLFEHAQEPVVDPYIFSSGYAHPQLDFDEEGRTYTQRSTCEFVPLEVIRHVVLGDHAIDVIVQVRATADFDGATLFEAIPLPVENGSVTLYDQTLAESTPYAFPTTVCNRGKAKPTAATTGENPDLPELRFRALDLANDAGVGAAFIFDREHTFVQSQPVTSRREQMAVGGFSLKLVPTMKAGEIQRIHYRIVTHRKALADARGL